MSSPRRITIGTLSLGLFGALTSAGTPLSAQALPRDLQVEATRHHCAQVQDFFDRPGMVLPPYLYGVFPGDAENSAAFWCQRGEGARRQFILVFVTVSDHLPIECPDTLVWKGGFPRGLSLADRAHVPLTEFRTLSGVRLSAPPNATTDYAPLRDYYDGLERLFYCYRGEWVQRVLD
jgi:hypothetical protein